MTKRDRIRLAGAIFQEHGPHIRQFIRRYVRDENDVDDIYQNIFLSLVRMPPSNATYLLAYMSRVTRNHAIDAARRAASYGGCVERYAQLRHENAIASNPEAELIHAEHLGLLVDMIETSLPPHLAAVIVERYAYGRDMTEAATRLGIKERTVSRYCCVGLKRIRELINEGKVTVGACS